MGSDQKVVVIADPGIRRTRPPETAVLAYRAVVAWEVRGVGGLLVLLARSFTRGSSEVACGTWLRH